MLSLALVGILGAACGGASEPAGDAPAFLRLVPCGGTARIQRPDPPIWDAVEAPLVIDSPVQLAALDAGDARLCLADGSLLELAPGAAIDVRRSSDGAHLERELQQGSVLLLAQEATYKFNTPACSVTVEEVPARLRARREQQATRLMVEQGSAICRHGSESSFLATCWGLFAAPGEPPQVTQTCGEGADASAGDAPAATEPAAPDPLATAVPPSETPSPPPSAPPQPTEEAPTATPEPSPIP